VGEEGRLITVQTQLRRRKGVFLPVLRHCGTESCRLSAVGVHSDDNSRQVSVPLVAVIVVA
jgi:hypothetical protein